MDTRWCSRAVLLLLLVTTGIGQSAVAEDRAAVAEDRAALDAAQVSVARLIERLIAEGRISESEAQALVESARGKAIAAATGQDVSEQGTAAEQAAPDAVDDRDAASDASAHTSDGTAATPSGTEADSAGERDVRVTYVPQFIRDELKQQVKDELRDEVAHAVTQQAKREGWGVPAGLPDWVSRLKLSGDLRVREHGELFDHGNAQFVYRDVQAINEAGGVSAAGLDAFLNTTQNRYVTQARLRLGVDANLGGGLRAGVRLATGNTRSPITRNATLGNDARPLTILLDRAYLSWSPLNASAPGDFEISTRTGRMGNPWMGTDLLWDADLSFEGATVIARSGLPWSDKVQAFATAGAFPLRDVDLTSEDPWLYGAQVGVHWAFEDGGYLAGSAAYYGYDNIVGIRNTPLSTLRDYTAPGFLAKGNTLFDIRNDTDAQTSRFALASDFNIVDLNLVLDLGDSLDVAGEPLHVQLIGNYVRNVGFDPHKVRARVGQSVKQRNDGYLLSLAVGSPSIDAWGRWRATGSWRHLERDAVLDAFTDSDFHAGGTDAEGWTVSFEYGLSPAAWMQLRYMSADEIDGPPLTIEVVQLDLNARF